MIPFPNIDPVAIEIGPLAIRWYALSYVVGILLGYRYVVKLCERHGPALTKDAKDNLVLFAILGVLLGGRIGYVLFYQPAYFLEYPLHVFMLWQGGMSFHGGAAGVIIAYYFFARKYKIPYLQLMDKVVCAVPIGLGLGRLANFINGELFGRISDVPWAMIFPRGGPDPRHPSQLYEAALEGLVLFLVLWALQRFTKVPDHYGRLGGIFLVGYGISRIVAECFREPDVQLGFFAGGVTMGQILSVPMILAGTWLIARAKKTA